MKKRTISMLLSVVLLLCGCNNAASPAETTPGPADAPEETIPETETQFVPDNLPDTLNFNGKTAGISVGNYANAYWNDLYSDQLNGNRMNDAVYTVITGVEDRLNADLNYYCEDFVYDQIGTYKSKIMGSIMAADDTLNLIIGLVNFAGEAQNNECFINLTETKYIDTEKPWYNQSVMENMPNDYIYFVSGSFALTNIKYCFGMYFNHSLMNACNITESLYDLVDQGKWTLDAMNGLISDTYADLDGDATANENDRYGLAVGSITFSIGFMSALDVRMFEKADNGYEYTYDSERTASAVSRLCSVFHENPSVYPPKWNGDKSHADGVGNTFISRIFIEGRSILTCDTIANAPAILSDIDFEYGLVPYPKWDEAQSRYQTQLMRSGYALIPTSADADLSSAVLEALSSASYRILIPEYFEETMKTRYSQDNNMSRMFDLIYGGIIYDPGVIFDDLLGDPNGEFYMSVFNNDTNWASKAEAMKTRLLKLIGTLVQ